MARHRLKVPAETVAYLRTLPPETKRKLRSGLTLLIDSPRAGKPLRAELAGLWSLRIGRLRIIYRIERSTIDIIAIGPRSSIYGDVTRHRRG